MGKLCSTAAQATSKAEGRTKGVVETSRWKVASATLPVDYV